MTLSLAFSDSSALQDLTGRLKLGHIAATGYCSVVYFCQFEQTTEVAVRALTFPPGFVPTEKDVFVQKVVREIRSWKNLEHPNIVRFLGIAHGEEFGSDYPCLVSVWIKNGSLFDYVKERERGTKLSDTNRVQLIKGSVAGLEYLHSQGVVHGDFHPGNILIDDKHNPCLTDFGLSLPFSSFEDQLSYLWADLIRPSRAMWTAPELLHPELYPNLKCGNMFQSDIYSLSCVILFIFSGKYPWRDRGEAEKKLKEFQNPPRPGWPINIPDNVWTFLESCWSPRDPQNRPSAQKVLEFCTINLEESLRPNPVSELNVVLLGAVGSGKSSIINLLAGEQIARVSADVGPCTERPRSYQISINGRQFRLWDTMGFFLPQDAPTSPLLPFEHANSVLRNLFDGVNLILFCADKGTIFPSLGHLYRLINSLFDGRAPIAFVVTHFDSPDEGWWGRSKGDIANRTGIPVESIPHACVGTAGLDGGQSKRSMEELFQTYAMAFPPISLRRDLSSYTNACDDLVNHCRADKFVASALVEKLKMPFRPYNVVFFGRTGTGKNSIINLIAHPVAGIGSGDKPSAHPGPHRVNTGLEQFLIWDLLDSYGEKDVCEVGARALDNTARSIHDSGGVDLLVLCTTFDGMSEDTKRLKLMEETISRGRSRVAVIVTDFDMQSSEEEWWEMKGKKLVMSTIHRRVVGHACIPPLVNYDPYGAEHNKTLVKSRISVETMLERSASHHITGRWWTRVPAILGSFLAKMVAWKFRLY